MEKRLNQNAERLIILFLLLFGAAVRLVGIGQVPPGLYHDEAQNGLDALRVVEGKFPLYFEANNGREPLFIYLIGLSVGILGRSPVAVRLPSFYIGFLTLAATYNLARALFDRRTSTICACRIGDYLLAHSLKPGSVPGGSLTFAFSTVSCCTCSRCQIQ